MRRGLLILAAALAIGAQTVGPSVRPAVACPNCKFANETDSNRPRAYMYSILFMLTVPAAVFAGFGIGLYRLSKKRPTEHLGPLADFIEVDPETGAVQPFRNESV